MKQIKSWPTLLCVLSFILFAVSVNGQQTVTSASVSGRVADVNNLNISGASLSVTNLETDQNQVSTSDGEGRFRFAYLTVGTYELSVTAAGFAPLKQQLTLTIGQTIDLALRLKVGEVSEQVTVTTDRGMLETVRTQVTQTIHPSEINELPLNGRNYLDLALLVPAVSPTNTGSNQRFAETSAVPGQGISVAGQRNLANSFIIDGMSANDDAADLSGTYYSEEVIREFQVITSGSIAEFGRASSGVVNILTKSGTKDWRGSLYGFARNQRFDARHPLASHKDELTQAQYGATLSGPIRTEHTFLFINFEQMRRNYSAVITIAPSAVSTINNRLTALNYTGPRIETGTVPAGFDTTNFFAKVDHQFNQRNQFAGRYSLYHITASNSRTVGGLNSVSRGSGLDDTDQTIALSNVTIVSTRTLNEARFQFTRSRLQAPINDQIGPAVTIAGVANFGTATSSPLARDIDLTEVSDNIATTRGMHGLKMGGDFLYNRINIVFPGALQGLYNFSSLGNFLTGNYSTFQQAFGAPSQSQANPNVGLFVQDEWRATRSLTINAGLRYDAQLLPAPIESDKNNFAPRLGIAFAPANKKTVIRAGVGLYYDRVPLRATSNALQRDGSKYIVAQFSPTQVGAPVFPNVLTAPPTTLITKPNITRIDPNIQPSYAEQANLEIERQLSNNSFFSIGYLQLRSRHLIVQRNVNVPRFPASAGVPNLGRPDPAWGNISRYESSGDSYYNGMIIAFNQRSQRWGNLRIAYTLSKAIDDTGNFFFSTPQNNFDLRDERGLSDNDQRHRLVISGSVNGRGKDKDFLSKLAHGFQFGYIFTYASPLPFNIVTGTDRNFDTNSNDRPPGVGRNTGRGFDFSSLDLRLSRRFNLSERVGVQVLVEGFNVLNHANLAVPNNTFGNGIVPNANFGQATAAFDPRQFQFGVRLDF